MRILITREFDPNDVIGYLELRPGVEIPPNSAFALGYIVTERAADGTPKKIQVEKVSLVAEMNYERYLEHKQKNQ